MLKREKGIRVRKKKKKEKNRSVLSVSMCRNMPMMFGFDHRDRCA